MASIVFRYLHQLDESEPATPAPRRLTDRNPTDESPR